jgi:cytochrome P450 family 110
MSSLPPGPRWTVWQTIAFARDPFGTVLRYARRYGDPFTLKLPPGPLVLTGTPEGIQEIFSAPPQTFASYSTPFLAPLVGEHSVLLLDGAAHKRGRSVLMPPFHGARLQTYGRLIQDLTLRCAAGWRPGKTLRMHAVMQALSMEITLTLVFGVRAPERVQVFEETVIAYFQAFTSLLVYSLPLRRNFGGFGPWSRFKAVAARLEQLLDEEISAQRQNCGDGETMLSLLLAARYDDAQAMTDAEVRDELKTLLIAGHETVAVALAWAFYWLQRQPDVAQRLQSELQTLSRPPHPDDLVRLPYLSAVCTEALRLYPVVAAISRQLRQPLTLRGYALPAGVAVGAAIPLAHCNPERYPEPLRFRPERFLEHTYTPFEYLPFGGGARRCIGAAFAVYELKIVLGSIVAQHRFELADGIPAIPVPRTFTLGPKGGVPLLYCGPTDGCAAR